MATAANLKSMWSAGYTYQVLQPQRYSDGIWRLVSALEAQLGCLVGCNAYLTPPKSQGLAPHHDDVELWICQTQVWGGGSEDLPDADVGAGLCGSARHRCGGGGSVDGEGGRLGSVGE
eukprot:285097-Chlamydomonas_euryale.AAC.3